MFDAEWVQELSTGDTVITMQGYQTDSVRYGRVRTVERVTNTLVVLNDGSRFKRATGYATSLGSSNSSAYLVQISESLMQDRKAYQRKVKLIQTILAAKLDRLSEAQLVQIVAILGETLNAI